MEANTPQKSYTLNDGTTMPAIGLGSAGNGQKESLIRAIMEVGYTHIDTAACYGNETEIGEALQECFKQGKKREELYITTKLDNPDHNDAEGALKKSLERLQLEYVDLYLIHWPSGYYCSPPRPLHKLWPDMEELVAKGLTKSIGVSNFNT